MQTHSRTGTEIGASLTGSGLFNASYYVSCYGMVIPPGMEPLVHFLTVGGVRGFKPSANFDPIVYSIMHPECCLANAAADALRRFNGGPVPPYEVQSIVPADLRLASTKGVSQVVDDRSDNLDRAANYGQETAIAFAIDSKTYHLHVPPADDILQRIEADRPLAMARISQGDWDALWAYEYYARQLRNFPPMSRLCDDLWRLLAARLCDAWHHEMDVYAEHFLVELYGDLAAKIENPDFVYCVAFKGYPTADERLFEWSAEPTKEDQERLRLFASFFAPEERLLEATVWKRWIISGELQDLPRLARQRPVILMAADVLADLDERWKLPWFLHIPIPVTQAYQLRNRLLEQCRAAIAEARAISSREAAPQPLFLMQGSSFAYWFMKRLFETDPEVFYLDVGQALHPWFFDKHDVPLRNWGRLYGPTIVRNNKLESFYRARGVADPVINSLFHKRR